MTRTKVLIFPSFDRLRVTSPEFYLPPRGLLLFFLPYGSESCFSDRHYRIICMVTPESKIETRFLREQWLFKDGNGEIVVLLSQMHKGNINKDNIDGVNMKSFPIKEVISNEKNGGQRSRGEAVRTDNGGAILPADTDGQGTSRLLEEVQKEDVQGNGDVGDLRRDDVVDKAEKEEKDKSLKRSSRNRLRRNRRRLRKAVTLLSRTVFLFLRAKRRVFARIWKRSNL